MIIELTAMQLLYTRNALKQAIKANFDTWVLTLSEIDALIELINNTLDSKKV